MALIRCPECGKEISNLSKVCVHCGYPLNQTKSRITERKQAEPKTEKQNSKKEFPTYVAILAIVAMLIAIIVVGQKLAEQEKILKYRAVFTDGEEVAWELQNKEWYLTNLRGDRMGAYLTFSERVCTLVDEAGEYGPFKNEYILDWKNGVITYADGDIMYDIIEYNGQLYLLQNPKADKEDWILFKPR